MTETFTIYELNGVSPGTPTSLTGKVGTFCTADLAEPGTASPNKVPTAGFYYSFWKTHYGDVAGSGWTSIRDIYWYCDGNTALDWGLDSGAGGMLQIGTKVSGDNGHNIDPTVGATQYDQADGVVNTTGYDMDDVTNGHTFYKVGTANYQAPQDADNYTSASPLLIDSTVYSAAFKSKGWCTQLKIPPTASHGALTSKTFTLSYTVY